MKNQSFTPRYQKLIYFLIFSWTASILPTTFEIIITSYNNERWCIDNLRSAVQQNYQDFHITYINDCSTDSTAKLIDEFIAAHQLQNHVTVIHNTQRLGALENLYKAIHACPDEIVVVQLDGDDWLPHENVLTRLDKEYSDHGVWLTYGQFERWPSHEKGFCRAVPKDVIERNGFRQYKPSTYFSQLRTFYAGLFKRISVDDLMYEGKFYPMAWDWAMMFPMLEMAGERHAFIPEVTYIYNMTNNLSDFRKDGKLQIKLGNSVLGRKPYNRLGDFTNAAT